MSENKDSKIDVSQNKSSLPPVKKGRSLPRKKKRDDGDSDQNEKRTTQQVISNLSPSYKSVDINYQNKNQRQIDNKSYLNQSTSIIKQPEKGIIVNVQGVIKDGHFYEDDSIFCKYDIVCGEEWTILGGQKSGQSQYACLGEGSTCYFVWNMPFDIRLNCENPENWPQLVISCFGPDYFGREILKAYGTCYFPTTTGAHERTLSMFSPISSYSLIDVLSFLYGEKAELINAPKILASGEGREILRCKSEGSIKIKFDVQCLNMEKEGFDM